MTMNSETRFFKEPTHDEIALHAFLAWERDGRPQCSDVNYWLTSEHQLRTQRLQLAEAAAAKQAARPWPPQSRVKAVQAKLAASSAKAPAPKAAALVRAVKKAAPAAAARTATVKVARTTKTAAHPATLPARATALRAAR